MYIVGERLHSVPGWIIGWVDCVGCYLDGWGVGWDVWSVWSVHGGCGRPVGKHVCLL